MTQVCIVQPDGTRRCVPDGREIRDFSPLMCLMIAAVESIAAGGTDFTAIVVDGVTWAPVPQEPAVNRPAARSGKVSSHRPPVGRG